MTQHTNIGDIRSVRRTIAALARPPVAIPFTEGRWPFTYAFDFVRCHPEAFGFDPTVSIGRADVSISLTRAVGGVPVGGESFLTAEQREEKRRICVLLAYAYCQENGIAVPTVYRREVGAINIALAHADPEFHPEEIQ